MAIWQYRLMFLPEQVLRSKYDVLPLAIPQDLAEDFAWWSNTQPPVGFERQISLILTERASWSTSMRIWGEKHGDDAYVLYLDESKSEVREIEFRINTGAISPELVHRICVFARQMGCVLMTSDYGILAPDESMVLNAVNHSIAKKFVDDPEAALRIVGQPEIQARFNYPLKEKKKDDPLRER